MENRVNIWDVMDLIALLQSLDSLDVVYGANSCKIRISEIQETMCKTNPVLKGKPKVLILQCCQGSKCQTGITVSALRFKCLM